MNLIFDLDDTLFPTSDFVMSARQAAAKAMILAGIPEMSLRKLTCRIEEIVAQYGSNYSKHFGRLCEEYGLKPSPRIIGAGIVAYHDMKQQWLVPNKEVHKLLRALKKKGHVLYLISFGKPVKQWEKLYRLNLATVFKDITILDERTGKGSVLKKKAFKELMRTHQLKAKECISIGDRIDSDISPANALGMKTIRILQGKRKKEKPQKKNDRADITIRSLINLSHQLRELY